MNSNQKPETPAGNTTAPEAKPAPATQPIQSERAARTNWMPFWRRVDEGIDPTERLPRF